MIPKNISEQDFRYNSLPQKTVFSFYTQFKKLLEDFAKTIPDGELEINMPMICRICIRVDQRKDYYMYYHSKTKTMRMSHEKELALWSYWVCKYKPIRFVNSLDEEHFFTSNGCTVSDAFAAYIMISVVCAKNKKRAKYFTPKVVWNLYYDLSNREFSKEAIIARIEDLIS